MTSYLTLVQPTIIICKRVNTSFWQVINIGFIRCEGKCFPHKYCCEKLFLIILLLSSMMMWVNYSVEVLRCN